MEAKNYEEAKEFGVTTPIGYLEAIERTECDYPGVAIHLDGILVARIEYDSLRNKVRTIAYNSEQDEPVSITNY